MATQLPKNEFISNSAVPVADEAAASGPPPPSDVAASLSETGPASVPPGPKLPADASVSAGLSNDIPELFRVANYLCAQARQFTPDYPGIYQAMIDPNAPRALETDPVWDDDAPLFLQTMTGETDAT